jgi:hypothetical protein
MYINKEVINYNSRLKEASGLHPNVKLLEIKLDRHHCTRHGLHLNLTGKKLVSQEVAVMVEQIFKLEKAPTSVEKVALLEGNNPTPEPNIDDKAESTKSTPDTVSQVALQLHGNLMPDNIAIQEPNLTDECADKEYPPQHQEPLLRNDIESQNSVQNEMMRMKTITQQKRHCPAKRNTDFFMELNALPICDINHTNLNNKYLTIYHQNVRSLRKKAKELLSHIYSHLPHIICITEHHMNLNEIKLLKFDNYNIGAQFCREGNKKGGVVMYLHNSLKFTVIDLHKHSKDKDIEIIGVKLNVNTSIIHIITLYRSPTGNFNYFVQNLGCDSSIIKLTYIL